MALLNTKVSDSQKHLDLKCHVNVINKETEIEGDSLEMIKALLFLSFVQYLPTAYDILIFIDL